MPDPADRPNPPGLIRDARTIGIATLASRVTGFARTAAFAAVLGVNGLRQSFEVANTLPNAVYELLLGGVLSATLVPLLVEARARGAQEAQAFAQRILTVVLLSATVLSLLAVLLAPVLVHLYDDASDPAELALTVTWARFLLPQILFYAVTATIGAILNADARFGAPVWAPVLNNVVVLGTLAVFMLVPGPARATVVTLSPEQLWTLGLGTTLGVLAMTLALLPSLRGSGFRWRLRLDLRGLGLRRIARMGSWVLLYVVASQLSFLVLTKLATAVGEQPAYVTAFTVWQLPYALVAVSVITALLPRMSAHAVAGRLVELRSDLDRGLRLALVLLVPATVAFVVLGRDVSVVLFAHRATSVDDAERIGWVLAVFAAGLVPFSVYQLQARAFYALRDTRTPALVQCAVAAVLIGVDLTLSAVLPHDQRVFGLAAGHVAAYAVGVLLSAVLLRRRLGPAGPAGPAGFGLLMLRLVPAGVLAGAAAVGVAALIGPHSGWPGALLVLAVAGSAGAAVYLGLITALRVPEARAGLRLYRG